MEALAGHILLCAPGGGPPPPDTAREDVFAPSMLIGGSTFWSARTAAPTRPERCSRVGGFGGRGAGVEDPPRGPHVRRRSGRELRCPRRGTRGGHRGLHEGLLPRTGVRRQAAWNLGHPPWVAWASSPTVPSNRGWSSRRTGWGWGGSPASPRRGGARVHTRPRSRRWELGDGPWLRPEASGSSGRDPAVDRRCPWPFDGTRRADGRRGVKGPVPRISPSAGGCPSVGIGPRLGGARRAAKPTDPRGAVRTLDRFVHIDLGGLPPNPFPSRHVAGARRLFRHRPGRVLSHLRGGGWPGAFAAAGAASERSASRGR